MEAIFFVQTSEMGQSLTNSFPPQNSNIQLISFSGVLKHFRGN